MYQKALGQAMRICGITKRFPKGEQYSLADQMGRSSRSISTNIGEAWRKRKYSTHFVSKLADVDAEATETMIWLDFSLNCGHLDAKTYADISNSYDEIGKMLGSMIATPETFCYLSRKVVS